MIYLFTFIYLLIGLAIGVVEFRLRQQYLPDNSAWWCIPLHLFFWLPIIVILLIVFIIAQFNKYNIK